MPRMEVEMNKVIKTIGFIGIGIMGKSMVRNLMKAGYELHVYTRTREKADEVVAEGAIYHETIAACVAGRDAVITMVGYPKDVEDVYFGKGGILERAGEGTYLVDMTTTDPALSGRIYTEGKRKDLNCLDAPVTGGDTGARNATLSILVGGEEAAYKVCVPLFQAMGNNIRYHGAAGNGQHAKMANQIMIAGTMSGICESLSYVYAKKLDPDTVLASVSSGAAGSNQLNAFGRKILAQDYAPGFFLKHFIKDMGLALKEAKSSGLNLAVLELVLKEYEGLETKGMGDLGTQALIEHYKLLL